MTDKSIVSYTALAAALNVSSRTLNKMCKRDGFPKPKKLGLSYFWLRSDLIAAGILPKDGDHV